LLLIGWIPLAAHPERGLAIREAARSDVPEHQTSFVAKNSAESSELDPVGESPLAAHQTPGREHVMWGVVHYYARPGEEALGRGSVSDGEARGRGRSPLSPPAVAGHLYQGSPDQGSPDHDSPDHAEPDQADHDTPIAV